VSAVLRVVLGVVALVASGLLLRGASQRLMRGTAMLFGASIALVSGAFLVGSVVWGLVQRRRERHRGPGDRQFLGFDGGEVEHAAGRGGRGDRAGLELPSMARSGAEPDGVRGEQPRGRGLEQIGEQQRRLTLGHGRRGGVLHAHRAPPCSGRLSHGRRS